MFGTKKNQSPLERENHWDCKESSKVLFHLGFLHLPSKIKKIHKRLKKKS